MSKREWDGRIPQDMLDTLYGDWWANYMSQQRFQVYDHTINMGSGQATYEVREVLYKVISWLDPDLTRWVASFDYPVCQLMYYGPNGKLVVDRVKMCSTQGHFVQVQRRLMRVLKAQRVLVSVGEPL